jgi:dihydrolipoamide dehydrogenase
MTSTEALEIESIPEKLLIVGGGYIGMELGTVYATLGSKITVVEAMDSILAGADPDLTRPVVKYAEENFEEIRTKTKVLSMATSKKQIKVVLESEGKKKKNFMIRS